MQGEIQLAPSPAMDSAAEGVLLQLEVGPHGTSCFAEEIVAETPREPPHPTISTIFAPQQSPPVVETSYCGMGCPL